MPTKDTSYNVVFIGETGVGKSLVIQRITDTPEGGININNDGVAATTACQSYGMRIDEKRYQIWDTAGLGEGSEGRVPAKRAEKALKDLLSNLAQTEGVHLLVFCMRAGRMTTASKGVYQTFVVGVCQKKVPALLVVTHLDKQADREIWWTDNGSAIARHEMTFCSYACVGWTSGNLQGADTLRSLISRYAKLTDSPRPKKKKKSSGCIVA
ncbi:hypothetical protein BS17DRAFT_783129 [Gyrodon lividus]|nr:hypothetical protein BS17DRAFT_783129 [Gyrodon lividus]